MPSLIAEFFKRNVTLNMGATVDDRPQTTYGKERGYATFTPWWTGYDTPIGWTVEKTEVRENAWDFPPAIERYMQPAVYPTTKNMAVDKDTAMREYLEAVDALYKAGYMADSFMINEVQRLKGRAGL